MKTAQPTEPAIAVIAAPERVDALRLAGVAESHAVAADSAATAEIPGILRRWISGGKIGVILIDENLIPFAGDAVRTLRAGKSALPVILEVPVHEVTADTSAAYYKALSREFLGLDVVLEAEDSPEHEPVSKTM
ncbi:MAG: hypothetical protein JJU00_01360 [Opitutales bacterium]|nr:hypothetical protein [Opitutales bacterium]